MKSLPFLLIILVLLIAVSVIFIVVNPFKTMVNLNPFKKYQIKEIKEFYCPNMTGFIFSYPVFDGWEVGALYKEGNTCIIPLNPDPRKAPLYETQRAIYVTKVEDLTEKTLQELGSKFSANQNPNKIFYNYIQSVLFTHLDPEKNPYHRVRGNPVSSNDPWDNLQFYGENFGVSISIEAGSEKHGFSKDAFCKEVIKTFFFYKFDQEVTIKGVAILSVPGLIVAGILIDAWSVFEELSSIEKMEKYNGKYVEVVGYLRKNECEDMIKQGHIGTFLPEECFNGPYMTNLKSIKILNE